MPQSFVSSVQAERIETGLSSGLNPKFSPDGSHLYFLAHEEAVTTGAHHGSLTLERVPWPSQGTTPLFNNFGVYHGNADGRDCVSRKFSEKGLLIRFKMSSLS